MAKWKRRILSCGIIVGDLDERLTNSRYADYILIYAKTVDEAVLMMEILIEQLSHIGLTLNAAKTTILHTWMPDPGHDMSFVDIAGDIVEILDVDALHTYLSKLLSLSKHISCALSGARASGFVIGMSDCPLYL